MDAVEVLAQFVEDYLTAMVGHAQTGRAFLVMWGAAIPADAALRPVFAIDDARFRLGTQTLLRAGQANGTVADSVDQEATAAVVVGMVRGIAAQYLIAPKAFDLPTAARTCRQFLRNSLSPQRDDRPT
ncbi:hypothetical protein D7D52_30025 [Nocardia yunnanensis]|uniref:BetI-type transcriptional repressor C-terminal domain-containing protein n=2 Tax=Nocardia yunnanensis TaxID=2382165 RepID=A0A386ZQ47_9NOCA|nr:hypothetical protein D7D52_30025 [Nocardia yunnanensis]